MAEVKDLIVYGSSNLIGESFSDIIHSNSFKTNGGTPYQFVKGDGSLDPNVYITASDVPTYSEGNGIDISPVTGGYQVSVDINSNSSSYLSASSSGLAFDSSLLVHLANAETITGTKTFTAHDVNIGSGESGTFTSLKFPKMIGGSDYGPYISGSYNTTFNKPYLLFEGNHEDEAVILSNVDDPLSDYDVVNKHYLTAQGFVSANDLATVATSGLYSDLSGTPTIPTVNNATLTIKQGGATKGTFTANASSDVTINLDSGGGGGSTTIDYNGDTITFDGTTPTTVTPVSRTVNCVSATGSSSTGKGTAIVKSFKGNGCTSWNQIVVNGNFADYNRNWSVLPHGWTASSTTYFGISYATIGKISGTNDGFSIQWTKAYSSNAYMYQDNTTLLKNHIYYVSCWRRSNAATYISMYNSGTLRTSATFAADTTGGYYNTTITSTTLTTSTPRLAVGVSAPAVGTYLEIRDFFMVDLTEMFGSGNEPTAAEFAALYPMNYYDYCVSTLVGCKNMGLASIGYNILVNGDTAIAPAGTYKIEGTYTSVSFINLYDRTDKTQLTVTNGEFTTTSAGYIYVAGYDPNTTCVHKSGTKTGYETPWINRVQIDTDGLTGVLNGTVSTIFPYGMMSVGSVYDEIPADDNGVATTAIKRIGIRDYESGDENDSSVVTNGTITAYELDNEEIYVLEHPINMTFSTDEYGIEAVSPLDTFGRTGPISSVALSTLYYDTPVRNTEIEADKRNIEDSRIQGMDSVPTQGSPNLVMSGGIKDYIGKRGIFYAVVTGQASSSVKNAVCPEFTVDDLKPGVMVVVRFTSSNTYSSTLSNICLDINNTGRYGIKKYQMTYTPGAGAYSPSGGGPVALATYRELAAASYPFVFTGNEWVMIGPAYNSTYANYSFGNGYAVDSRTGETPSTTTITATYSHSYPSYYALSNNGIIGVYFKYDVGEGATLNISGKGAQPILYRGAPITSGVINAEDSAVFVYSTVTGIPDHSTGYVLLSVEHEDFDGSKHGLVPTPPSGYSENLGAIYMKGDGEWSEFATDVNSVVSTSFLPITGGTLTGGDRRIKGLMSTLPDGVTMSSEVGRGYAASLGIVQDNFLNLSGGTMSAVGSGINMNGSKITNLPYPPVDSDDAVSKKYVDSMCTNREWSNSDHYPSNADGSKAVQAVYVTGVSSEQDTLTFSTGMEPNTTCHIFAYAGSENTFSRSSTGTLVIPYTKTARGTAAGSTDTIIVNNKVVWHGNRVSASSGENITIDTNKIVEISVMYQTYDTELETWHRTIIKTAS